MNRTSRNIGALLLLLVVIIVVALFLPGREPQINGQPLTEWLEEQTDNTYERFPATRNNLHTEGAQLWPYLLEMMQTKDMWLLTQIDEFDRKQDWLTLGLRTPASHRHLADRGFALLGASAAPAIPTLTNLLNDAAIAPYAIRALGRIGPPAATALLQAMTHTNADVRSSATAAITRVNHPDESAVVDALLAGLHDTDQYVRWGSLGSLSRITNQQARALPVFLEHLESPDRRTRAHCLYGLGNFGTNAAPALPIILRLLREPTTAFAAGRALAKIDLPLALTNLSALVSHEQRDLPIVSLRILQELGTNALPVLPTLVAAYAHATNGLQFSLWHTIRNIDPTAADRLGLKAPDSAPNIGRGRRSR